MESNEIKQVWEDICSRVESYDDVDTTQVKAFFSKMYPQAMSEGFLMLTVENNFMKSWIEKNYLSFIKQALLDIYNVPFNVMIEIDENLTERFAKAAQKTDDQAISTPVQTVTQELPRQEPQSTPSSNEHPSDEGYSSQTFTQSAPLSQFTFENFVVGDSNRMAYHMALTIAKNPGKHFNPLFIYGKSGLGKTHLMRAIQNYICMNHPELKTIYVDSSEFLSDYMDASIEYDQEKTSYKRFKTRYEESDVLLIDDIQYFQGKTQTLDIVFQIFNKLIDQGKQVVLSADRAPKNIDIDERYQTRFNSGGTFDIQPPEFETKMGIIINFIKEYNEKETPIHIPDDIQMYIAENSSSNIRELKSAITAIIYHLNVDPEHRLTLTDVKSLLEDHFSSSSSRRLNIADIQKEVETFYKVSHSDLVGDKRSRNIVYARQIAIYLCRQMTNLSYDYIGEQFNRDHTTVIYSVTSIEGKMSKSREVQEEIEALKKIIREL